MSKLTVDAIDSSNDDELFGLLGKELETRISVERSSPAFLDAIRELPVGLRAMAATYELDVSLALDDLGWHFGNWHSTELAEETARGLEELGASELAGIFREAFRLAQQHWERLAAVDWMDWYHGSELEKEVRPLNSQAWELLKGKDNEIFKHWVNYARRYPERVGAVVSER
jgi:hypothetical protein